MTSNKVSEINLECYSSRHSGLNCTKVRQPLLISTFHIHALFLPDLGYTDREIVAPEAS